MANRSLGTLAVYLSANTSGFERGINQAKSGVASFKSFALQAAGAVGLAFSFTAAIQGVRNLINEMDNINDAAARLDMSGEVLQTIQYAFKMSGATAEDAEMSIRKLSEAIINANDGNKTAQAAFEKMGIAWQSLKGMKAEDAFSAVAKAIAGVPDAMERTALAVDIFGKSGTKVLAFAGDLENLKKELIDSGSIMSNEALQAAAAFNDSMDRLDITIKGLVVSSGLVPWLADVADSLQKTASLGNQIEKTKKDGSYASGAYMNKGYAYATGAIDTLKYNQWGLALKAITGDDPSTFIDNLVSGRKGGQIRRYLSDEERNRIWDSRDTKESTGMTLSERNIAAKESAKLAEEEARKNTEITKAAQAAADAENARLYSIGERTIALQDEIRYQQLLMDGKKEEAEWEREMQRLRKENVVMNESELAAYKETWSEMFKIKNPEKDSKKESEQVVEHANRRAETALAGSLEAYRARFSGQDNLLKATLKINEKIATAAEETAVATKQMATNQYAEAGV